MANLYEKMKTFLVGGGQAIKVDTSLGVVEVNDQSSLIWKLINKTRTMSKARFETNTEVDRMAKDAVIGSAIELIAEDATQTDLEQEKTVWIESKNRTPQKVIKDINEWLENDIKIEALLFPIATNIIKYGECFLKTFISDKKAKSEENKEFFELGKYFEFIEGNANIYEVLSYGKVKGFFVTKGLEDSEYIVGAEDSEDDKNLVGALYAPKEFIHFISDKGYRREVIKIKKGKTTETYKFRYGTTFLETVREIYKVIFLIENILIASRLSRSAFYRLFQVNVGTSGRTETIKIINEVKKAIKSKELIDLTSDLYRSDSSPIPVGDNIYIPTRSGKGEIALDSVGGDVDVKEIVDVDYFKDKLFAALKVPKAFLGFEESLPGGIGNTTLTRLDIRYARTVKRVQTSVKNGIKDLVNCYLEMNGLERYVDKFVVKMSKISSAEESDRREDTLNRVSLAESLKGLFADYMEENSVIDPEKFLKYVVDHILGLTNFEQVYTKGEKAPAEEPEDGEEEPEDGEEEPTEEKQDLGESTKK